jgi:hypothetical protein
MLCTTCRHAEPATGDAQCRQCQDQATLQLRRLKSLHLASLTQRTIAVLSTIRHVVAAAQRGHDDTSDLRRIASLLDGIERDLETEVDDWNVLLLRVK